MVATPQDGTVRLAVPLGTAPRRPVVDVAPLPHLLPLVDEVASRVPHVVVLADRTGADVSAYYDTDRLASEVTVTGHAPDIRKVPVGGWSHLRYQHRAENGWAANAREIVPTVVDLAEQVGAELVVLVGDERELTYLKEQLPQDAPLVLEVPGGRGQDGSAAARPPACRRRRRPARRQRHPGPAARRTRRSAARASAPATACPTCWRPCARRRSRRCSSPPTPSRARRSGSVPGPAQLAATRAELVELGVQEPQEGPLVDVLLRAAVGTGADVQLVPGEMKTAPDMGIGAVLRYADSLGTVAAAQ